ncbi:gag/pol protein [Gossypium australe]|uniref:Gag/pol protein n=1 Tax=Gossypium australe TaxID=47621 RepID=A0A5B6X1Y2_9ROSI|nr:gag/pol protein [Gossypium australe]
MDLSKHLAHGIKDLIKRSRLLDLRKWTLSLAKLWLTQQFSMKDLEEANFVLKKKVITLSQASFIDNIFEHYTMTDLKKRNTPSVSGFHLYLEDCPTIAEEKENIRKVPYIW